PAQRGAGLLPARHRVPRPSIAAGRRAALGSRAGYPALTDPSVAPHVPPYLPLLNTMVVTGRFFAHVHVTYAIRSDFCQEVIIFRGRGARETAGGAEVRCYSCVTAHAPNLGYAESQRHRDPTRLEWAIGMAEKLVIVMEMHPCGRLVVAPVQ